jgi:hypothetical protein
LSAGAGSDAYRTAIESPAELGAVAGERAATNGALIAQTTSSHAEIVIVRAEMRLIISSGVRARASEPAYACQSALQSRPNYDQAGS